MKLAETTDSLRVSQPFDNTDFSIGDPLIIMEYLRKNAYSNPKRSICQEVMSNARDAHREVGTPNKAIEVRLPTRLNPIWSCKDFGPGISPDRMDKVVTKFGNSTKRDSNNFTGGFGVGFKLPWSYTDTFLINTVCNINGTFMKYAYAAVIGDNRVPKLIQLADPVPTDEHSGTTISFNVDAKDFHDFTNYSYEVCQYWNPHPNIVNGDNSRWKDTEYKFSQPTWGIVKERQYNDPNIILIDSIPYTLNLNNLGTMVKEEEKEILKHLSCHFRFNVGELTVSLNREGLYYDDKTIKSIILRFREMIKWINKHFEDLIAAQTTLWDAAIALKEATSFFNNCRGVFKTTTWRGKIVPTNSVKGGFTTKIITYERDIARIRRRTKENYFNFTKNSKLVLEDAKRKIEYQFELDPTLQIVYVLKYQENIVDPKKSKDTWDKWYADHQIADLQPIPIDSLPVAPRKARISSGTNTDSTPNIRIKTYIWKSGGFIDAEVGSKVLKNGSGVYVPCYRRHAMRDNSCEHEMDDSVVGNIISALHDSKLVVYGIQKDLLPHLGKNWVSLYDYFKAELLKAAADLKVPVGYLVDFVSNQFNEKIKKDQGFGKILLDNVDKLPKELATFCKTSVALTELKDNPLVKLQATYCSNLVLERLNLKDLDPNHILIYAAIEKIKEESKLFDDLSLDWDREYENIEHLLMYFQAVKDKQDKEAAQLLQAATAA